MTAPLSPRPAVDLEAVEARIRACRPRTALRWDDADAIDALEDREALCAEVRALRAVLAALRSPAMDRVLERAHDSATEQLPEYESAAKDPRLLHRAHYARQAEQCREELKALDALVIAARSTP